MKLIFEAKKPDEQVTAELQALYPQWDFSNVEYYFDQGELSPNMKGQRYLNNLYCPIEDENGNPHGVSNNLKVAYLYNGTGGCRTCRRLSMGPKRVDFEEYKKNFPKDRGYNFDQAEFYREKRGNTERRFVKNVICTKHDPPLLFAQNGVNIDNLRKGTTGCPECRKEDGSIGEKKINDILTEKGYLDFETEKKFTDCKSVKESNRCTRLKFDFYFKDKGRYVLVEYDGEQHFRPNAKHGGEEKFKDRVINDAIKNRFTKQNNIKLIRIAYTDAKNIEKEFLAGLESPNQLYLSTNYPKLGWNDPLQVSETSKRNEYILTERQVQRIVESQSELLAIRRRITYKHMDKFIQNAVEDLSLEPCDNFDDEIDFANQVINHAIDNFVSDNPQIFSNDETHELENVMYNAFQMAFFEELMDDFFQICSDDDEDMMLEQVEGTDSRIISKLFKLISTQKTLHNTRGELMKVIKNNLPIFGIPENQALYILELYLLNFRKDGDYSDLTKGNFIDPRDMKGKKTANVVSHMYTKAQLPFQGSNLQGYWTKDMNGVKYYIVKSYGWYPVYIYKEGKWYENFDRYSSSTSKQMYKSQPYTYNNDIDTKVYLMSRNEMDMLESGYSHEDVMKKKKESFRDVKPSTRLSTKKSETWRGYIPHLNIKFRVSSVDETEDKNIVNVDIIDVIKTHQGKQIPTPENYLKGEIPNVTPESIEKEVERKLKENFREYLGPKFGNPDEELITFKFNHLKK